MDKQWIKFQLNKALVKGVMLFFIPLFLFPLVTEAGVLFGIYNHILRVTAPSSITASTAQTGDIIAPTLIPNVTDSIPISGWFQAFSTTRECGPGGFYLFEEDRPFEWTELLFEKIESRIDGGSWNPVSFSYDLLTPAPISAPSTCWPQGSPPGFESREGTFNTTVDTSFLPRDGSSHTLDIRTQSIGASQWEFVTITYNFEMVNILAPTVTLTASPTFVSSGGSSTLTWVTSNANSCTASGGSSGWPGNKNKNGGNQVMNNLTSNQTYTITCTNSAGSNSSSASVTVSGGGGPPAPVVSLTAALSSIAFGDTSTLTWTVSDADSCTASGGSAGWAGSRSASGSSWTTGSLTSGQTYTITCTGAGGSDTENTSVTVGGAPVTPTVTVSVTASPSSGSPPLTSSITATVGGTATGLINYKFDCNDDNVIEFNFNQNGTPRSRNCTYSSPGSHTARVTVTREGVTDNDPVSVAVSAPVGGDDNADITASSIPTTFQPEETKRISFTVRNNGSSFWYDGNAYQFRRADSTSFVLDCDVSVGGAYAHLPYVVHSVGSGHSATSFPSGCDLTAPSTPDTYTFAMQMVHDTGFSTLSEPSHAVIDGGPEVATPFGEMLTQTITVLPPGASDNADITASSIPTTFQPEETKRISFTVRNNGSSFWWDGNAYQFRKTDSTPFVLDCDVSVSLGYAHLPYVVDSVSSGHGLSSFPSECDLTAPSTPDTYTFTMRMVHGANFLYLSEPSHAVAGTPLPIVDSQFGQTLTQTITVAPLGAPSVSLTASPTNVAFGDSSTLTWVVSNADSCTASAGDWSGSKSASGGSESTGALTSDSSYTITCTGTDGTTVSDSAAVTVGASTGTINVNATYNGSPWTGPEPISYTLFGPSTETGFSLPGSHGGVAGGVWTLVLNSGGPPSAVLASVTPSNPQTLTNGGTITYTLNFTGDTYTGDISGSVVYDIDASGAHDPGETYIKDPSTSNAGCTDPFTASGFSISYAHLGGGPSGTVLPDLCSSPPTYDISGLPAGDYSLSLIKPADWVYTGPSTGSFTIPDGGANVTDFFVRHSTDVPTPDLIISSDPTPDVPNPTPGQNVKFTVGIQNTGGEDIPGGTNFVVQFFADGVSFSSRTISNLDAGEINSVTSGNWSDASGTYSITTIVDDPVPGIVTEVDETNNSSNSVSITVSAPPPPPACDDTLDNDGDTWIDSADPGCWTDPTDSGTYDDTDDSEGNSGRQCSDGTDNDTDGFIDGDDPDCSGPLDPTEAPVGFEEF